LAFLSASVVAQIGDIVGDEEIKERTGSSILDDSTKQIYGPTTSKYTFERNIKYNLPQYWAIDTSVYNRHRYHFLDREENYYQDQGNIGTPTISIFPMAPQRIGATSGFTLYDLYAVGPEDIRYFDTKSPYSNFSIVWGGEGRARTDVVYARNIDERSGFGFDFRGLFIDKQISRTRRGDRNADVIEYNLNGHYATKNGKYRALGNFIRNRHEVEEYGGVLIESDSSIEAFFDENRIESLQEVSTEELRTNYHLYHQYQLKDQLQIYHSYDRYKQQNDFLSDEGDDDYFGFIELDSLPIKDRSKIVYRQHELGVKGDFGKTFYNFYYKARDVDFDYKWIDADTIGLETEFLENYLGFNLRFGNDSLSYIEAYGEAEAKGNFKLGGSIKNSWFFAEGVSVRRQPTFAEQAYRGRHDRWVNDFDSPITTTVKSGLNFKLGRLRLAPSATYSLFSNYIYFSDEGGNEFRPVAPVQASGDISLISGQLGFHVDFFKILSLKSSIVYSQVSGGSSDAVQIPELFTNTQLSASGISFEGNLEWHVGFDVHWKSEYFGYRYDPAIMQYYVQDDVEIPAFPIVDFFANGKINRGRFFFKVNNLYELINGTGYFATPGYPGQSTVLDFGFDWSFYD